MFLIVGGLNPPQSHHLCSVVGKQTQLSYSNTLQTSCVFGIYWRADRSVYKECVRYRFPQNKSPAMQHKSMVSRGMAVLGAGGQCTREAHLRVPWLSRGTGWHCKNWWNTCQVRFVAFWAAQVSNHRGSRAFAFCWGTYLQIHSSFEANCESLRDGFCWEQKSCRSFD